MKKYFMMILAAMSLVLVACGDPNKPENKDCPAFLDPTKHSDMQVMIDGDVVTDGATIRFTEYEESLAGGVEFTLNGTISGAKEGFRVTVTRHAASWKEGWSDEFCAVMNCMPGDGENTQDFDFTLPAAGNANWFAHFLPSAEGDYNVDYKFQNYDSSITVHVVYAYHEAN